MSEPSNFTDYRGPRLAAAVGLAVLLAAGLAGASDPPHWSGAEIEVNCTSQCHVTHNALGGGLNPRTGNVNLCQSCHQPGGHAALLPINEVDKAVPGVGGIHHGFQVCAVNSVYDTQVPTDTEMALRVMTDDGGCDAQGGYVVCSTCHDQHDAEQVRGGTPRISDAKKVVDQGGGGTVTSGGTFNGAEGYWYWVEIVDISPSDRFCWAKANDAGVTWFPPGCDPPNSVLSPNLDASGLQSLDSGVEVTFDEGGGQFADRELFEFYASWPFLRDELNIGPDSGGNAFCANCHAAWQMTDTSNWNGGAVKSHPVGVAFPSAETPLHSPPLDGNGYDGTNTPESPANPTNDLVLYGASSDTVECLTCHGIHFVDSNTTTEDGPQ